MKRISLLLTLLIFNQGLACAEDITKYVALRTAIKTPFGQDVAYTSCAPRPTSWPNNKMSPLLMPSAFVNWRGPYLNKGGYDVIKSVNTLYKDGKTLGLVKEKFRSFDALITTSGPLSGTYKAHSSILPAHFPQIEMLKEVPYFDRTCVAEWDIYRKIWINRCSISYPDSNKEFCMHVFDPKVNYAVRSLAIGTATYGLRRLNITDYNEKNKIRGRYLYSLTDSTKVSESFSVTLLRRNLAGGESQGYYKKFYENNVMFVSPSVGSLDFGDNFTLLSPFHIVSEGRSGSDSALLFPMIQASASIPKELKTRIMNQRMLVPTLSYLFKNTLYDDYLNPKSHNIAYLLPAESLDKKLAPISGKPKDYQYEIAAPDPVPFLERIVKQASELTHIPPVARIKVYDVTVSKPVSRTYYQPTFYQNTEYNFNAALRSEENIEFVVDLFDSWVDTGKSINTYGSVVLRGPGTITKLKDDGSLLRIKVPYLKSSLVKDTRTDILLYVNDGSYNSAPAYISVKHIQAAEEQYYFK